MSENGSIMPNLNQEEDPLSQNEEQENQENNIDPNNNNKEETESPNELPSKKIIENNNEPKENDATDQINQNEDNPNEDNAKPSRNNTLNNQNGEDKDSVKISIIESNKEEVNIQNDDNQNSEPPKEQNPKQITNQLEHQQSIKHLNDSMSNEEEEGEGEGEDELKELMEKRIQEREQEPEEGPELNELKSEDEEEDELTPEERIKIERLFKPFEPYISPKEQKNKNKNSTIIKTINQYNQIKSRLKVIFEQKRPKTQEKLTENINSLLNYLDNLNGILDTIIGLQKMPKAKPQIFKKSFDKKNTDKQEQTSNKLVNVYKKEYEKALARLNQVSDEKYLKNLNDEIEKVNKEITCFENDNRQLRTNQIISENLFKKKINIDSISEHLSKLMAECEKYNMNINNVTKKIEKNLEIIKGNEEKIKKLEERHHNLDRLAHEMFKFSDYDDIKKEKKKDEKMEKEIANLRKKKEVFEKAFESNKRKYEPIIIKNQELLVQLESDKNDLMELLQSKIAAHQKDQAQNFNEFGISENDFIPERIEKEPPDEFIEHETPSKIRLFSQLNEQSPIRKKNDVLNTNQSNTLNKAAVLKELDKKQKEEKALHNLSVDNPKINSSIVLKKIALKPNFSFNHEKINNNVQPIELPKINQKQNEIKEDIHIDSEKEEKENTRKRQTQGEDKAKSIKETSRVQVLNTAIIGEDDLINHKLTDELENDLNNQKEEKNEDNKDDLEEQKEGMNEKVELEENEQENIEVEELTIDNNEDEQPHQENKQKLILGEKTFKEDEDDLI